MASSISMSSTWLSVVLVCFLGFFFSPVNVSAGFIADCQQAEIDGLFLTMTPGVTSVDQTVNFGLANATGTAFQLFTHPNATQRQLLSYSAPLFLVNQIRLSQTITDHNIEILTIPFNENIPGVTPFISISLNGVFLRAQDGGIQFPVPANSPIPFRFIGQFLGDGTVDTPNLVMINITSFGSNGQGAGYNTCAFFYLFNITNPSNRSVILGDPQFVGLRGQSFQVHGIDGAVYNLISDRHMQLNARFAFLTGPRPCPIMPSTGKKSAACWSHAGSYLGEMGLKTSGGSKLKIISGPAASGFSLVTLNDQPLKIGATHSLVFSDGSHGHVTFNSSHELTLTTSAFDIEIENNDEFVNLRSVRAMSEKVSKLATHGLLGQTWRNKRYSGKIKEIEGDVDDYIVDDIDANQDDLDADLFGDNFMFNRFISTSQ